MSLWRASKVNYMYSTIDKAWWNILERNMVWRRETWHEARPNENIDGSLSEDITHGWKWWMICALWRDPKVEGSLIHDINGISSS